MVNRFFDLLIAHADPLHDKETFFIFISFCNLFIICLLYTSSSSKVSPIRPRKKSNMTVSGEIMVLKPRSLNDAYPITQALWNNCTVILNLEEAPTEEAQRIVDFSSGTCFALSGRIEQISPSNNKMLVITPETVELSGDFQERMGTALDVHSRF